MWNVEIFEDHWVTVYGGLSKTEARKAAKRLKEDRNGARVSIAKYPRHDKGATKRELV